MRENTVETDATDAIDSTPDSRPRMTLGWIVAAETGGKRLRNAYEQARNHVLRVLNEEFPDFCWEMPLVLERRFAPYGTLPPMELLELGLHEKLYRGWDFALVLVPNELAPRDRVFTLGVPSSALEVAVLSSARLTTLPPDDHPDDSGSGSGEVLVKRNVETARLAERLAMLALHLLGHIWGLEHDHDGPMNAPEGGASMLRKPAPFPTEQHTRVQKRLAEVADARVEEEEPERRRRPNLADWLWLTW